jgi:hypothetical protein
MCSNLLGIVAYTGTTCPADYITISNMTAAHSFPLGLFLKCAVIILVFAHLITIDLSF